MKHTYKITKASQWKCFSSVLWVIVGMTVGIFIISYYDSSDISFSQGILDRLPFFLVGFLAFFTPLLIIHLKYYSINEGMEVVYDDMEKSIMVKDTKKGIESKFNLEEIKVLFHSVTAPRLPWNRYSYSDIFLKDGRMFRITSLMVYRLQLPIGDKYEIITSLYPYPSS